MGGGSGRQLTASEGLVCGESHQQSLKLKVLKQRTLPKQAEKVRGSEEEGRQEYSNTCLKVLKLLQVQ